VDKLVKVWTPAGQEAWVLVHVEVPSQHDAAFAERMYTYNHRLRDKYGRMPVSLAVLGDESRSWCPDAHREGRWGCEVRFAFPIVKLVDYTGREEVLEADANPFAVVTLARLKAQETKGDRVARYDWKMRLVKGLYDRGFDKVRMVRLFNVIAWVVKLSQVQRARFEREMQAFEKERAVERLSPTFRHYWDDGAVYGFHKSIEILIRQKFGQAGLNLLPRLKAVTDSVVLERLIDAVSTVPDLDAFRNMLPAETPAS
jgi:hypothetical protein